MPNRTNETPYNDGYVIRSRSGKKYYLKEFTLTLATGEEYRYFKVKDSSKRPVGSITQHTPIERLESLLERYEKPDHMEPFVFVGVVHHSNNMPYVTLPDAVVRWYNVLVDDAIQITMYDKQGHSCTHEYHIDRMKNNLILSLSPFKWHYVHNGEVVRAHVTKRQKDEWYLVDPDNYFPKDGEVYRFDVEPLKGSQRFTLADDVVLLMKTKM